jgi:trimethylamine:corrinoid methyltransferase-like protein
MNIIGNNTATTENINIAEQIFGSDIGAMKGKTVRRTPRHPNELIQSQQNVKLCIDIMYVIEMQVLTTISKNIHYRTAQYIASKSPLEYAKTLKEVLIVYKKGGFKAAHIFCDN